MKEKWFDMMCETHSYGLTKKIIDFMLDQDIF